jgi:hypothetical protein
MSRLDSLTDNELTIATSLIEEGHSELLLAVSIDDLSRGELWDVVMKATTKIGGGINLLRLPTMLGTPTKAEAEQTRLTMKDCQQALEESEASR